TQSGMGGSFGSRYRSWDRALRATPHRAKQSGHRPCRGGTPRQLVITLVGELRPHQCIIAGLGDRSRGFCPALAASSFDWGYGDAAVLQRKVDHVAGADTDLGEHGFWNYNARGVA